MGKGLMHVYCGDGKGKTTAAIGLAVRAAGCGKRVVFAQFMKGNDSGEIEAMKKNSNIEIIRNNRNYGFFHRMSEADKQEITLEHNRILDKVMERIGGGCDMLVMDELTYPYAYGLIDKERVKMLIYDKPEEMELVITGRDPGELFMETADYITEMKCVRHPFWKGIEARRGVEY